MASRFYDIEVEWMDGKTGTFHVGGCRDTEIEKDGVLHLFVQDGTMAPLRRVISIPLVNVRKYGGNPFG